MAMVSDCINNDGIDFLLGKPALPDPVRASGSETGIAVRLQSITYAAAKTNLYTFCALDGSRLPSYEPGAHIDVLLPNGITRQYSLALPYSDGESYTIGVKLDDASRGGSRYMHEALRVGARLYIYGPRNHFLLSNSMSHTVLIAGGIGITPIWCMIKQLQAQGRSWELHYSVRKREEAAFLKEMAALESRVKLHVDEEQASYMSVPAAIAGAPPDSEFYCCGPTPMLNAFKEACVDQAEGKVHFEYFGVQQVVSIVGAFVVQLARSNAEVHVPAGVTILDALSDAGYSVPSSCKQGVCGMCETRVVSGIPDHRDVILTAAEKSKNQTMMICCSGCVGERLVLDL